MCNPETSEELRDLIGDMSDAEIIKYCEDVHISFDSAVVIKSLVSRLRFTKRKLFESVSEMIALENELSGDEL